VSERARKWQAQLSEEKRAHIFLAHGLMLCEKGGNTFAQVVITAHVAFCSFTCWSCAAEVPMNEKPKVR